MSDLFGNDIDSELIELSFACLKASQPIGDIYVATISHEIITKISYFDVRRLDNAEREVERYLGVQRPLNLKRVVDLKKYVNHFDASFPTSIIIAIDDRFVDYDADHRKMTVRNYQVGENTPSIAIGNLARIIDGQHRIAGLAGFQGSSFDLTVTIFVGADVADQAHIFATVNLEQTKVSKSLAYDLYELSRSRSPQKTCHNIAVALDRDSKSPLYKRIKRLGLATEGRTFESITQATFVESLMDYISPEPKLDRDVLLRSRKLDKVFGELSLKFPFRNLFIEEKDIVIAQIVFNYFGAIRGSLAGSLGKQGTWFHPKPY